VGPPEPHEDEGEPPTTQLKTDELLGRHRWKVERSLALLLANRRLTVRYERADLLTAQELLS
jgi:hypothetical protein